MLKGEVIQPVVDQREQDEAALMQERDKLLFKKLEETFLVLKKDPELYSSEVAKMVKLFQQQFAKVTADTTTLNQRFVNLSVFLAQVSHFYKKDLAFLGQHLTELLRVYGAVLQPYVRRKSVSCLLILRAKNLLPPVETFRFLLTLLSIKDKSLRKLILSSLINDIKRMNKHRRNAPINKQIQLIIQDMLNKQSDGGVRKALKFAVELYQRGLWRDPFSINVIASGCFNESHKVRLAAAYFLQSTTQQKMPESDSDQQEDPFQVRDKKGKTKRTRSKINNLLKQRKKLLKKKIKKLQAAGEGNGPLPIDQIYNPQKFCERLFARLQNKDQKFAVKMVFMPVLSRMMRRHRLLLPAYFSYIRKYLVPAQKQLLKILLCLAEAVHPLVDPEDVSWTVEVLIQKIISENCSDQCITMGINCLRQMVLVVPELIEPDQAEYLCYFYQYKNKNVSNAAKSLINVLRTVNRNVLPNKYRGRPTADNSVGAATLFQSVALLGQGQNVISERLLDDDEWKTLRARLKKGARVQEVEQLDWENAEQVYRESEQSQGDDDQDEQDEEGWQDIKVIEQEFDQNQAEENVDQEEQVMARKQANLDRRKNFRYQDEEQEEEEEEEEQEEQEQPAPGVGFLSQEDIGYFKLSKKEHLALKKQQPKDKKTFGPKQKGGGTNDKEKQKHKPLMMIRHKKNRQKRHQTAKQRVKEIENRIKKQKKLKR